MKLISPFAQVVGKCLFSPSIDLAIKQSFAWLASFYENIVLLQAKFHKIFHIVLHVLVKTCQIHKRGLNCVLKVFAIICKCNVLSNDQMQFSFDRFTVNKYFHKSCLKGVSSLLLDGMFQQYIISKS